jgi:hypothetical protein
VVAASQAACTGANGSGAAHTGTVGVHSSITKSGSFMNS